VVDYKINRLTIWSQSLDALSINPVVGIGVANNPIGSAHSNYLQIAVEQGLFGLTIFLIFLVTVMGQLIKVIQNQREAHDAVFGIGLLGGWTWFSIQGLLSTTLFNDKMFLTFAVVSAITTHYLQKSKNGQPQEFP